MPILSAQNLGCHRNHNTLFSDVSFELSAGQLLLIEGKNGVGKTTLLKIITQLRRADSGDLFWNKQNLNESTSKSNFAEQLAWLGHQNPLKEDLTALENLNILQQIRPANELRLDKALSIMGLGNARNKKVKTFSAGMKRRLALASLLISNCKLWVLDEPQAALDKQGIALFEKLATEHLQNNGMIIMTSHHAINIDSSYVKSLLLGNS